MSDIINGTIVVKHNIALPIDLYKDPYNTIRRAKIILFDLCLNQYPKYIDMKYDDKIQLLQKLERSCYNTTIDKAIEMCIMSSWDVEVFCDLYHSICYKVSSNIDCKSFAENAILGIQLLEGKIDIKELPKMSSQELCPSKYVDIKKKIEISKSIVSTVKTTTMYTCKRCKKNMCTLENAFLRSIDEGVDVRVICQSCNLRWVV
jgi:DNA-directed RNA polymerase subunit M/transcription elongation factor TFIIS